MILTFVLAQVIWAFVTHSLGGGLQLEQSCSFEHSGRLRKVQCAQFLRQNVVRFLVCILVLALFSVYNVT